MERVAALLKHGSVPGASVAGPMAEVVFHGTQHLPEPDVDAMAGYLRSLPVQRSEPPAFKRAEGSLLATYQTAAAWVGPNELLLTAARR